MTTSTFEFVVLLILLELFNSCIIYYNKCMNTDCTLFFFLYNDKNIFDFISSKKKKYEH